MFDGLLGLDSSLGERAASMPESAITTRGGTPANVTAFSSYTEKGNIYWQPVNLRGASFESPTRHVVTAAFSSRRRNLGSGKNLIRQRLHLHYYSRLQGPRRSGHRWQAGEQSTLLVVHQVPASLARRPLP